MHSWFEWKHLCSHCYLINQNELNKDYIKAVKSEIISWWMGIKPWISHSAIIKPPFETSNKNKIQTLCLQLQCAISSTEVQQGLALSASLLTSSKVSYYRFSLQRRMGSSHRASQKLVPDRNELLPPGSSSDNLSETDTDIYKDFVKCL